MRVPLGTPRRSESRSCDSSRGPILQVVTEYDPDAFDAFEEAGWTTKEASAYHGLLGRVTSQVAEPLLDAVGARRGTRLLDVATGPGYVAARAAERGAEPIGVDFSDTMLAYARAHVAGVEFVHGDATALPFEDESFDAVVAAFVLLHLGTPERAVEQAARVLRSGGRAAFSVWDEPSRGRWIGVFFEAFVAAGAHPPADVPAGPNFFSVRGRRGVRVTVGGRRAHRRDGRYRRVRSRPG